MKLLVLAQIPPPLHGQSLMVQTLVSGLSAHGIEVRHVNLRLSRTTADIGRWHPGKILAVLDACVSAIITRFRENCDTLYYVPAPGKRGALYRDWVVMLLCRPFFRHLVLHWHASGLGEWLDNEAHAAERGVTRLLLGRATLAIVLGDALRADAGKLSPRRTVVIRNGLPDPCPGFVRTKPPPGKIRTAVFLGLIVPEKGVLDAIAAVRQAGAEGGNLRWQLILAGSVPDPEFASHLAALIAQSAGLVRHAGFVQGPDKHRLLAAADALVFPTYFPPETQGLVVAEALAYDLPVIVTAWRAVAENLPASHVAVVPSRSPAKIARALEQLARTELPGGALRRHFLAHYTADRHLAAVAAALRQIAGL